jgi:hypothetical protein
MMAAAVIVAAHQHIGDAGRAHFAEGDLLRGSSSSSGDVGIILAKNNQPLAMR